MILTVIAKESWLHNERSRDSSRRKVPVMSTGIFPVEVSMTPTFQHPGNKLELTEKPSQLNCCPKLPVIFNNNLPLRIITEKSLAALKAANNPPILFQQNGRLVRIRINEGSLEIEQLGLDALRGHMDRSGDTSDNDPRLGKTLLNHLALTLPATFSH